MLIYNSKKEFLGIDKSDLNIFGFSDLSQLLEESADFADLFVRSPGYIHNFKHVHWIDFITCSESIEDSKVIIHVNDRDFSAVININIIYLADNPSKEAYEINLLNLYELLQEEKKQIGGELPKKSISTDVEKKTKIKKVSQVQPDLKPAVSQQNIIPDVKQKIHEEKISDLFPEEYEEHQEHEEKTQETVKFKDELKADFDDVYALEKVEEDQEEETYYNYDPHIASEELGLPIDLIEEFVQDFINQANDFKNELYTSLKEMQFDNVKILSHKLKGVAANLRIEDAFELLKTINTSNDYNQTKKNLNKFYVIISKLSGEKTEKIVEKKAKKMIQNDSDDLAINFKDDIAQTTQSHEKEELYDLIDDVEISKKIEMPELTDDIKVSDKIEMPELTDDIKVSDKIEMPELIDDYEVEDSVVYNKNSVANEIGINIESFNQLFEDFLHESKILCDIIKSAVEKNNVILWNKAAIKLKGMSENMRIHDISQDLDTLISAKETEMAKNAIDHIDKKLKQISNKKG